MILRLVMKILIEYTLTEAVFKQILDYRQIQLLTRLDIQYLILSFEASIEIHCKDARPYAKSYSF